MKRILLLLLLLSCSFVNCQNLFNDNLNSYTPGIDLNGQGTWTNNSSFPGGAGTASASGPGASKIIDTGMSYLNYGTSLKSCDIKINSDACGTPFTVATGNDLYVGVVLNLTSAQANNNSDFFRVLSGGNYFTSFRMYATPSGSGFVLGIAKGANGNPISTATTTLNFNQDHLIIFKYSKGSGASDDVVSLYVDAVYASGVPAVADAIASSGTDQIDATLNGIDRMILRQNWTNGMPTGRAGLFSVALTWETLTFNLSNNDFNRNSFVISGHQADNGILTIKSNSAIENAVLNIYDIQGKKIETKTISLQESVNDITINPIRNTGVYIVEILSETNQRFTQKIMVN